MEDSSFLTAYHGNDDHDDDIQDVSVTRRTRNKCECKASLVGAIIAIVVIAAVVAVVVIAVPLSVTYLSSSMSSQTSTTCLSAECIKLSASVLAALDRTVDPCTNFYEFSCGNWIQNTTIPPGEFISCMVLMISAYFIVCILHAGMHMWYPYLPFGTPTRSKT